MDETSEILIACEEYLSVGDEQSDLESRRLIRAKDGLFNRNIKVSQIYHESSTFYVNAAPEIGEEKAVRVNHEQI
jgi:hypothetical protein